MNNNNKFSVMLSKKTMALIVILSITSLLQVCHGALTVEQKLRQDPDLSQVCIVFKSLYFYINISTKVDVCIFACYERKIYTHVKDVAGFTTKSKQLSKVEGGNITSAGGTFFFP
jgi:hypothetical protein